jgi:hypothetical protein
MEKNLLMLICYFGRNSKHHKNVEDFKTLICYCRRHCRNLENVKILRHCGAYFYYSSKISNNFISFDHSTILVGIARNL